MPSCTADLAWFLFKVSLVIIFILVLMIADRNNTVRKLESKLKAQGMMVSDIRNVMRKYPEKKGRYNEKGR